MNCLLPAQIPEVELSNLQGQKAKSIRFLQLVLCLSDHRFLNNEGRPYANQVLRQTGRDTVGGLKRWAERRCDQGFVLKGLTFGISPPTFIPPLRPFEGQDTVRANRVKGLGFRAGLGI